MALSWTTFGRLLKKMSMWRYDFTMTMLSWMKNCATSLRMTNKKHRNQKKSTLGFRTLKPQTGRMLVFHCDDHDLGGAESRDWCFPKCCLFDEMLEVWFLYIYIILYIHNLPRLSYMNKMFLAISRHFSKVRSLSTRTIDEPSQSCKERKATYQLKTNPCSVNHTHAESKRIVSDQSLS